MNVRIKIISKQLMVNPELYKLRLVTASPLPWELQITFQCLWCKAKRPAAHSFPLPDLSLPLLCARREVGGFLSNAVPSTGRTWSLWAQRRQARAPPSPLRSSGVARCVFRFMLQRHCDKHQEEIMRQEEGAVRSEGQRGCRRGGLERSRKTTGTHPRWGACALLPAPLPLRRGGARAWPQPRSL